MAELKKKALSEPEEDEMKRGIEKYIEQDSSIPVDNQIEDSDEEIDIEIILYVYHVNEVKYKNLKT